MARISKSLPTPGRIARAKSHKGKPRAPMTKSPKRGTLRYSDHIAAIRMPPPTTTANMIPNPSSKESAAEFGS